MSDVSDNFNIARHLASMAARQPNRAALKIPRGRTASGEIDYLTLSFAELETEVDAWCDRLHRAGIRRGDRTLLMVRQGLPLIAAAFALFKLAAVPVVIDPGMGLKSFLSCVRQSRPRALVGIALAQLVSRVARGAFTSVQVRVAASASLTARIKNDRAKTTAQRFETATAHASDLAAVLFTSGSTGAPKGVCYEHSMFEMQVHAIRETYAIQPGEIDLPMLPIFALFNPALGMTTVVPEMDPRRPAQVDPAKIVQAIQQENITNSFGSPTLWRKIGDHCINYRVTLPSLRRVLCAGAPVPASLWERSRTWMPNGRLHSPYGATEALPVTSISSDEIARVHGIGACVGHPVGGAHVKIIAIHDDAAPASTSVQELAAGEIGEIIVSGPTVTKMYDAAPAVTAASKIAGTFDSRAIDTSTIWHRMGDCGYLDEAGFLWFCGRKVERVVTPNGTLFTEPCEQVFRSHPGIRRCALIGLGARGQQRPALCVESSAKTDAERSTVARSLREWAQANEATASIARFYFHPNFPVDVRHNAKIHRLTLARWATTARAYEIE